jgi:hypothetical protein
MAIFVAMRRAVAVISIIAAAFAIAAVTSSNTDSEATTLYLGSGNYGGDNDGDTAASANAPPDRGTAFDSRTETPAYDGTHNIKNHGILAGSVDPACAVLPRKKCLPSNLAEWRHGTPLPKKYADFVQALDKEWNNPEPKVDDTQRIANPGSKEARFFFHQDRSGSQKPPWDHPDEAQRVFKDATVSNADQAYDSTAQYTVSDDQSRRISDRSEDRRADGDSTILKMRAQIAQLKEEVRHVKARRELERGVVRLQEELRRMNSGDSGDPNEYDGKRR